MVLVAQQCEMYLTVYLKMVKVVNVKSYVTYNFLETWGKKSQK